MRRSLYLLAVIMIGAASVASAQRAITVARLLPSQGNGPPAFAAHVSNLLDDPDFVDRWNNAFYIQVHWKVQLWKSNLIINSSLPPVEWNVCVRQVPGLDLFSHTEGKKDTTFSKVDSLKAHLLQDVTLGQPKGLGRGEWYYLIDVHVSTAVENPCDPRVAVKSGGILNGIMLGNGPTRDLPQVRLTFPVR